MKDILNISSPFKKKIIQQQNFVSGLIFRLCQLFILIILSGNLFGQTTQTFLTTGAQTWTAPIGVTSISVECWGGGGAGGGATGNPAAGGGGAGGSYSKLTSITVTPGQTYSLFVGAGGTGSINAGNPGESSWFFNDTTILAKGGNGGSSAGINSTTATGAVATLSGNIGDVKYYGGAGGTGTSSGNSSGAGGSSAGTGSNGNAGVITTAGAAVTGGGAGVAGISNSFSSNGISSGSLGGAGSGAHAASAADRSGGNGGAGKIVLTFTCPVFSITSTTATTNVCSDVGSTITLTGNASSLPIGSYTVTYNLSAPNLITGATATMIVTVSGNGSFIVNNLTSTGSTTIKITSIKSGSGTGCASAISTNNTAAFMVTSMPAPIIEFTQSALDTTSNIAVCGTVGGGGQNDMDIESGNPGGSSVIQWQISSNAGVTWSNAPGPTATATQYVLNPVYCDFESLAGIYYFRVIITNGSCVGISNRIKLTVTGVSDLTGGTIGSYQNYCISGDPSTLTQLTAPTGAGGSATYTYQWQSSTDSINFSNISGATTSTYNPALITQTTYYRRVTVSGGCRSMSNIVTVLITLTVPSVPDSISGYSTVCQNSTGFVYTINPVANSTSYTWSVPSGWTILSGSGTTSITVSSGGANQSGNIRVMALNVCGLSSASTLAVSTTSGTNSSLLSGNTSICTGTGTNLQVSITGGAAPYQIVYSDGANNYTLGNYSSGSNILVSPIITTTYSLVSVSSVGGCYGTSNSGTPTITIFTPGTWLGTENNNWNNANNWCGGIPTSTTNVLIPAGRPNSPDINDSTACVNNLVIASGAELSLANHILKIFGAVTSNGNLNCTSGSIELRGTSTQQNISGSMFYNKTIKNLKLCNVNGINFSGTNDTLKITGVLDFGASNVTLNTNGNLTMSSTITSTSCVGDMTSNGQYSGNRILGNVTVERYFPNHSKAWRLFSSPTIGQSVKASIQEGNAPLSNSTHPGYGTIITSNLSGATTALGFDIYTPAGGTMKTYNSVTNAWDGIPSTSMTISNTKGYMLFIRGDRSVTVYNQAPTATTLRTTGTLYTPIDNPPQPITIQSEKFESVGNPYASAVDFSKIAKSGGVQNLFYVWDPELTCSQYSAYGLGGYQTIVADESGGYTIIPGGGSYSSGNANILSGQAFLIHTVSNSGQFVFSETSKTIENESSSRSTSISPKLSVKFSVLSGPAPVLLDGVVSQFDDLYSNEIDGYDALKIGNSLSENIGILRSAKRFSMERRSMVSQTDTVFYNLGLLKRQSYQFDFNAENLSASGLNAKLIDKFLGTSTSINLDSTTSFLFTVTTDPLSYAADRFYLVFNRMSLLPVNFIAVSAKRKDQNSAIVNWKVNNEIELDKYSIQRSFDGTTFETIGNVLPKAHNTSTADYLLEDNKAQNKLMFYRIKSIGLNGVIQYSNIVKIYPTANTESISISPNPVINKEINLRFNQIEPGNYSVAVYNSEGRLVKKSNIAISAGQAIEQIQLKKSVMSGNYNVVITDSKQKNRNISIQIL